MLDQERRISDKRISRHVRRTALAVPVTACIQSDSPVMRRKPSDRLSPLIRMSRQSMKQKHRRPLAAGVEICKAHAVACQVVGGRHRPTAPPRFRPLNLVPAAGLSTRPASTSPWQLLQSRTHLLASCRYAAKDLPDAIVIGKSFVVAST